MSRNDFMLYFWGFPFLGAFLGFILAAMLSTGEAAAGIMIMLGVVAGYLATLTLTLSNKFASKEEDQVEPDIRWLKK